MADGALVTVKVTKPGDETRNPPAANAVTVKNGQTLERTWEDEKKPVCK